MAAPLYLDRPALLVRDSGLKQMDPLPHGNRMFYKLPQQNEVECSNTKNSTRMCKIAEFMSYINDNVIGRGSVFFGPFGQRKVIYCDYTASGRCLEMIEDYIRGQVLPLYGNTHTTTTVTSLQTTLYRHEARDIIRNAVNASEHDAVIFVGTGCTAAVHKLIHALNLQTLPVVFVGPFEHHSNLLPWREIGAEVVSISQDEDGLVDLQSLERELKRWHLSGRQLIGCFSAASNITGILTDDVKVTVLLHQYGALAFWDYATAGPYVDINMNPVDTVGNLPSSAHKDAVFLSPHKFIGGVETPGVLVAKKVLFRNPVPSGGGGGSVFFVSHEDHRYLKQVEMREEGGTPSIVGAIRAGLVFQLKEAMGADNIMAREHELCRRALVRWSGCANLVLLGNTAVPRLPIFSFLIRHPATGQFLHHNFVCAVLNDVFGIQARGGCACAGPYAQDLLGIDKTLAKEFEEVLLEDSRLDRVHLRRYTEYSEREILRPGFTRLNLPYFMDDECVDFVLNAVAMVAQHAWKLLPQYIFNPETGEWKQRNHRVFQDRRWLGSISYADGKMVVPEPPTPKTTGRLPTDYQDCLRLAEEVFKNAEKVRVQLPDQTLLFDPKAASLRWFMLPSEALELLCNKPQPSHHALLNKLPFEPITYKRRTDLSYSSHETGKEEQLEGVEVPPDQLKPRAEMSEAVPEDLTESSGKSDSDGERSSKDASKEKKSFNTSPQLSCADLFQRVVEEGFIGDKNDALEIKDPLFKDLSTSSDKVDFCVKGQTETQDGDVGDLVQKETCGDAHVVELELGSIARERILPTSSVSCDDENTAQDISRNAQFGKGVVSLMSSPESTLNPDTIKINQVGYDTTVCDLPKVGTDYREGSVKLNIPEGEDTKISRQQPTDTWQKQHVDNRADQPTSAGDKHGLPGDGMTVKVDFKETSSSLSSTSYKKVPKASAGEKRGELRKVLGFQKPPKNIFKPTVEALEEYRMIEDGDRVLVCLSGGKDSLSLLHTLRQYQFYAKSKGISFKLGGVTVDPQTLAYDPRPLIPYLASLEVPYFYEEQCIIDTAASLQGGCDSICSFCSRMKRGRLYACARREGYNVLAMGQHLDDLAESFLMSVFHNGLLRTMKANYTVKEGDLRVIRPFVYTREKDLRDFAEKAKLPVIPENCPACFEAPKERHRTKQLLASQELLFPRLYSSLQTAMKPLMAKNRTGMESGRKKEDFFEDQDL